MGRGLAPATASVLSRRCLSWAINVPLFWTFLKNFFGFFQAPWQFAACQPVVGEDSLNKAKKVCNNSSQIINLQSNSAIKNVSGFEQVHMCSWDWYSPHTDLTPHSPRAVEKLCPLPRALSMEGGSSNLCWGGNRKFSPSIQ